jgi:hypothetical protein
LQAMSREKHIQSGAKATARHMILLLLPSVRLELVNGFDRNQNEKRGYVRQIWDKHEQQERSSGI